MAQLDISWTSKWGTILYQTKWRWERWKQEKSGTRGLRRGNSRAGIKRATHYILVVSSASTGWFMSWYQKQPPNTSTTSPSYDLAEIAIGTVIASSQLARTIWRHADVNCRHLSPAPQNLQTLDLNPHGISLSWVKTIETLIQQQAISIHLFENNHR